MGQKDKSASATSETDSKRTQNGKSASATRENETNMKKAQSQNLFLSQWRIVAAVSVLLSAIVVAIALGKNSEAAAQQPTTLDPDADVPSPPDARSETVTQHPTTLDPDVDVPSPPDARSETVTQHPPEKHQLCLDVSRSLQPSIVLEFAGKLLWSLILRPGETVFIAPDRQYRQLAADGEVNRELEPRDRGNIINFPGEGHAINFPMIDVEFAPKPGWDSPIIVPLALEMITIHKGRFWEMAGGLQLTRNNMPVLTQQNFLSAAEISNCLETLDAAAKWQTSTDDSRALGGDSDGNLRQSTTWWCDARCRETHPALGLLSKRVSRNLDVDEKYFDALQFVRYDAGDFYHAHSDHSQVTASNPRVITLLVYLEAPEDGSGSTRFPALDLDVLPVPGKALLWRNTAEQGITVDGLALSEDLAVHQSNVTSKTKVVVNVWMHLYPVDAMAAHGC